MVTLVLKRKYLKDSYTIGALYIHETYLCDTLEDKVRDYNMDGDLLDEGEGKVPGETAIPYGVYEVRVTESLKFGRALPLLLDVPHFTGIRMHAGNHPGHTEGCILVGENKMRGGLVNSRKHEERVITLLRAYEKIGINMQIAIT